MLHSSGFTVLLALALLVNHVIAAPAPAPITRRDASISWGSCESFSVNSTNTNWECAHLEVPMDYHDSTAGNARLAVIKVPATAKKMGTVFFNPGGPGGSGIQSAARRAQSFAEYFQGTVDLISWDPRGVGDTFPGEVYCFDSAEEDEHFWDYTPAGFINETISGKFDEQDLKELYSKADLTGQKLKEFAARCQNSTSGPYLKYVWTSSTVRDLVSLGDAILGQGQPISYWGVSYGTVIGFNLINMFPKRVGHVVLDGVVDPSSWITYKLFHDLLTDTEKTYAGLCDACAKAGSAGCKLVEITGDNVSGDAVKMLFTDVHDMGLELYRSGLLEFPPGYLKVSLFGFLYTPQSWSTDVNSYFYPAVAYILQLARAHNVAVPGGRRYNVPSENITNPISADDIYPPGLTSYTQMAISGADDVGDSKTTVGDIFDLTVDNTRDVSPTFGAQWSFDAFASHWTVRSVEPLPPYNPVELKNRVLVIGNAADPITPFAGAKHAATLLGENAFLLEQLGFGHTSLAQSSSCTASIVNSYLLNGTLPQGYDAQCPVDDVDLFPLNETTTTLGRSNFKFRVPWVMDL